MREERIQPAGIGGDGGLGDPESTGLLLPRSERCLDGRGNTLPTGTEQHERQKMPHRGPLKRPLTPLATVLRPVSRGTCIDFIREFFIAAFHVQQSSPPPPFVHYQTQAIQ